MHFVDRPSIEKDKTRSLIKTVIGISTNIACFVKSGLPVVFNWTKNGMPVASKDSIRVYENILVLTATGNEDFGVYTCAASNDAGTTTYNVTVAQAENSFSVNSK